MFQCRLVWIFEEERKWEKCTKRKPRGQVEKPDPCMMIIEVGGMIDNHWTDGNWCLPLVQAVLLCLFDTQEYCQSQALGCWHCYSSSCNRILVFLTSIKLGELSYNKVFEMVKFLFDFLCVF